MNLNFDTIATDLVDYDDEITVDGDTWAVWGVGALSDDESEVVVHLASKTRFRHQNNGRVPVQVMGWFNPYTNVLRQYNG